MTIKKNGRSTFLVASNYPRTQQLTVSRMVEDVVGCKWSMAVLQSVRNGVNRPGAIERGLPGLTTKVLNERLRKLVRYGILSRCAFNEVPPRVEYQITPFGQRFAGILDLIEQLQDEVHAPAQPEKR